MRHADDVYSILDSSNIPKSDARVRLRNAFSNLCAAVEPLLHDFLTHPAGEEEAAELQAIRHAYLPEIITAYNTAISFAGTFLTREHFTKSLDLADVVAADENRELVEAFTANKRMVELVKGLAFTQKRLIGMNEMAHKMGDGEESARKRRKVSSGSWRESDGRTVDIWKI